MKKWITVGLVIVLLAALGFSLSQFMESQRLSQEVNALQRQRNLETEERNRQATAVANRRTDLISTISQQKQELEKIQKLLDSEKENTNRIAQGIGASTAGPTGVGSAATTGSPTSKAGLDQYQSDLEAVRKDLLDLRSVVDKLKEYAASLEKNLNVPAPELMSTPLPTSTPLSLKGSSLNGMGGSDPAQVNPFNGQLIGISQDLGHLGDEIQSLLQRYTRLESAALRVAQSNISTSNTSNTSSGPTFASAVSGAGAEKLAQLSYAPKGWPVRGPITSIFGARPSIFSENTKTGDPKGGNNPAPTQTVPQGTPIRDMATVTALIGNLKPTSTAAPATTQGTQANPATTPKAPEPTPTATASTNVSPTATLAASPTVTATATPAASPATTVSPATSATPAASVAPTATFSAPVNGPAVSSGSIAVGPGMEFHSGIDIGVPEGTEVHATASGVVEYAGDQRSGYGNVVFINHPGGFITIYGHNSRLLVTPGQTVKAGDVIALSGNTGYSTGPHVHYEIRYQGQVVDPAPFMR